MYLLGYLRPYPKYIIQLMLGMLTGSVISMIFPFLTQSIVDYGINNSDLAFIVMVLVARMVLTLGQTANGRCLPAICYIFWVQKQPDVNRLGRTRGNKMFCPLVKLI